MQEFNAKVVFPDKINDGDVEVVNIQYDLEFLDVQVSILATQEVLTLRFDMTEGFRVLDERDLHNWWQVITMKDGWCFKVESGGWLSQESSRTDFMIGSLEYYKEFLIIGLDTCVSVIAQKEPVILEGT
ncbi:hypothetical protein [Glaciecola sp. 33A]|jgi:hypothetical protein|uniref:hypothetical protein n=1 Tax=Glaciecola sp. 33A TaxID=2057807 RepID=UPI000C32D288|nr:hypothetical protein [Glaciecola sp. 33A]PKI02253.1 hypothetical protein CXF81_08020 [Glaciecola sp. 33A]